LALLCGGELTAALALVSGEVLSYMYQRAAGGRFDGRARTVLVAVFSGADMSVLHTDSWLPSGSNGPPRTSSRHSLVRPTPGDRSTRSFVRESPYQPVNDLAKQTLNSLELPAREQVTGPLNFELGARHRHASVRSAPRQPQVAPRLLGHGQR
jgi:hypothetical protein